jgi:DNA replication protein DnaC
MRSSPVPPIRYAARSLADFDPSVSAAAAAAYAAAEAFIAGTTQNLVLVGQTGTGKTHLAAAIVNETWRAAKEAYLNAVEARTYGDRAPHVPDVPLWANVAEMMVRLRLEMNAPLDDRPATLLALDLRAARSIVVLDDLGQERQSDWTAETIYTIVNARYERRLRTVITSNLPYERFVESPYWPVISRMAEDGKLIEMRDTPDYRFR